MVINRIINKLKFHHFQSRIYRDTFLNHDEILSWAERRAIKSHELETDEIFLSSNDEIVKTGYILRKKVLEEFENKYDYLKEIKILIHLPEKSSSPGGYSLFSNMGESIRYLGVQTEFLQWNETIDRYLNTFKPTFFLSSDSTSYLQRIDWQKVLDYKKLNPLKIGLTASLQEYGNTPLIDRLKWAKDKIDFYYSFRSPNYLKERKEYNLFFENGYKILSIEFGANPLLYFPVPNIERDLNFVFLASSNPDKQKRYFKYLTQILRRYSGFIDGPGWSAISRCADQFTHKYLYARAKVGINLHIDDSIEWSSELNERTYILAACGVPQLVDNAKLLPYRFSRDSMFVADSPESYLEQFMYILKNYEVARKKALNALIEVYGGHTTFHRADGFLMGLEGLL